MTADDIQDFEPLSDQIGVFLRVCYTDFMKIFISLFISLLSFSVAATEISLSWTAPTVREDGTPIESPLDYRLYYVIDNVEQPTIELHPDTTSHTIRNVIAGTHTFQISAIESGNESELSLPASKTITGSRPGRITIIIE